MQVIFTGDWSMPVREAESANALVDAGCDVITCHVDGPKVVIETAEKRGVKSLRPQRQPGAACAERLHHRRRIQMDYDLQGLRVDLAAGKPLPNFTGRRIRIDFVQNSPFGAGASPEGKKAALAAIEGLKAKKPIYVGPLKDNKTGKVVIDKTYDNLDPVSRQDGLPARGRRRLDDLKPERTRVSNRAPRDRGAARRRSVVSRAAAVRLRRFGCAPTRNTSSFRCSRSPSRRLCSRCFSSRSASRRSISSSMSGAAASARRSRCRTRCNARRP